MRVTHSKRHRVAARYRISTNDPRRLAFAAETAMPALQLTETGVATGPAPAETIAPEHVTQDDTPSAPRQVSPRQSSLLAEAGGWLRGRTWEQWAFFGLFVLAAVLRLWGLGDKPLHHDESLHAYYSWQFLINPSEYLYDPLLHGPFLFHIVPVFFVLGKIFGAPDNGIDNFTARLLPALMGMAMVPMIYYLRSYIGRYGALAAALLLAVSPSFVYYSRFLRDDIFVTCCALLLVVASIRYAETRKLGWLLTATAALTISYTAMENTFFIIGIFGSFLFALVLWDLGPRVGGFFGRAFAVKDRALAGRIILFTPFVIVLGAAALIGLHWLSNLSATINALAARYGTNPTSPLNPDVAIAKYENIAFWILIVFSIVVSIATIAGLTLRMTRTQPPPVPRWYRWVDQHRQPVLDTLLETDWVRWFLVFITAMCLFGIFFTQIPQHALDLSAWGTGFKTGTGRGLLQGIYYWLEQQNVARGGQPWYYYFILIPLYEPLILVFGLAGFVRSIIQPTRFRLFVAYWFATTLLLYSWAGEKMPWLVVHILLPMVLLSGIALEWPLQAIVRGWAYWQRPTHVLAGVAGITAVVALASMSIATTMFVAITLGVVAIVAIGGATAYEQWSRWNYRRLQREGVDPEATPQPSWHMSMRQGTALGCMTLAVALLVPTVWNMQRVSFFEPSVAPNEMLIYVQTTDDVQKVMDQINQMDQAKDHGKHTLRIAVTAQATWPFAWYLRDYTYQSDPKTGAWTGGARFEYSSAVTGPAPDVILAGYEDPDVDVQTQYPNQFQSVHDRLRWWWDESYKLPLCVPAHPKDCLTNPPLGTGYGPLLWISYGAYPPQACASFTDPKCTPENAQPNGAKAAQRYWNWLWLRQNISGTPPESTDFMVYFHAGK
jgi:uncharacterized protein (TIGR03663 family)